VLTIHRNGKKHCNIMHVPGLLTVLSSRLLTQTVLCKVWFSKEGDSPEQVAVYFRVLEPLKF
jgi:hypothetical protein